MTLAAAPAAQGAGLPPAAGRPAATPKAGFADALALARGERRDYRTMTAGELDVLGQALFRAGKLTLDELFHFQNPTGRLRIGARGPERPSPGERVDFLGRLRQAVSDLERTGQASAERSPYPIYRALLAKIERWQA